MKIHNGMRPQDIIVLLKIVILEGKEWQHRDLSASLFISASEISQSLVRSSIAGLYENNVKKVKRNAFVEFIQYGLPYVFPQLPGPILIGMATAHSHSFYKEKFIGDQIFVWPYSAGTARGQAIEPLHKEVPKAALQDELLYKLLASIDILRVGRVREKKLAIEQLKKHIL
jgi:hypothetical protein